MTVLLNYCQAPVPPEAAYSPYPEREAMKTYIEEALGAGIIRSSTFTAGAVFIFVNCQDLPTE